MAGHGHVWWTELMTSNIERAIAFYENVMGWEAIKVSRSDPNRPPQPGERSYTVFRKDGEGVCGVFKMEGPEFAGVPDYWFTYISVNSVDDACKKIRESGGQVLREPHEMPYIGRIAVVMDPDGAVIGIGTPVVPELA